MRGAVHRGAHYLGMAGREVSPPGQGRAMGSWVTWESDTPLGQGKL